RDLDGEGVADPGDGRCDARRGGVGEHVQQVRPDQPVRRVQGVRVRPGGWPARSGALPRGRGDAMSSMTRVDVRKTYKLFVGGKCPRSESGRTYEVTTADGTFAAKAALGSRKVAGEGE